MRPSEQGTSRKEIRKRGSRRGAGSGMETRRQRRKKSRRQAGTKTEKEGKRIKDDIFSNLYIF